MFEVYPRRVVLHSVRLIPYLQIKYRVDEKHFRTHSSVFCRGVTDEEKVLNIDAR
jgi:hypothetical protein